MIINYYYHIISASPYPNDIINDIIWKIRFSHGIIPNLSWTSAGCPHHFPENCNEKLWWEKNSQAGESIVVHHYP